MKILLRGLFYFFFFIPTAFSQSINEKSLLWEISGNGLTANSYLFGTIHIQDKRVFNLSDSLIIAIENCNVFAAELNFDSLSNQIIELFYKMQNNDISINEILTEDEYEKLNERAKDLIGISIDDMSIKDPRIIAFIFEGSSINKDMPYSVDEFLYKIAKSNNCSIKAVEEIGDQISALNEIDIEAIKKMLQSIIGNKEKSDAEIEQMIKNYSDDNLTNLIHSFNEWEKQFPEMSEVLLYKRNYKMLDKIEQMISENSSVIAVGAAHLFGEKGLVNLMRNKGYDLRPIIKINTGLVNDYLKHEVEAPWLKFIPSSKSFEIEMPGKATVLPVTNSFSSVESESGMFIDISEDIVYLASSYLLANNKDIVNGDSLFDNFINNLVLLKFKITSDVAKINFNGIEGREFDAKLNLLMSKTKIFINQNKLFYLQILYPEEQANTKNIDRFFSSFKILETE